MKTVFQHLIVYIFLTTGVSCAKPLLNKSQMLQVRDIILSAKENKEYKGLFSSVKPTYNEKTKLWEFKSFPVTLGGSFYKFEYRESDSYYILGWMNSTGASHSYKKFRIQPSIRKKLKNYLNNQPQKNKSGEPQS